MEGLQILTALGEREGPDHPAVRMWRGHAPLLATYVVTMCTEWTNRGYRDTLAVQAIELVGPEAFAASMLDPSTPRWLEDDRFHDSHKSNLARMMPEHYVPLWEYVPRDLPLVWPAS